MLTPLEDLFRTRTNRDRLGTIPDEFNRVLLLRDLERLFGQGLIKRMTNIREISPESRQRSFFQEVDSRDLYVFVEGWDRGGPEFRRYSEASVKPESRLVQGRPVKSH